MTDERRETAAGAAAVRPRALPEGTAPDTSGTGTPTSDQPDPDPPDTAPPTTPPPAGPPTPDVPATDPARADRTVSGSSIGGAETRALIRAQLRTALGTGAFVVIVVTALPALTALVPAVARARVHGVPLPWLLLAFGVQPVWIAAAFRQLGRAERAERELPRPAGPR
ncbi:hypothetical protein [Actinomadura sp. WMMA1423]|uniref:hypothetical protein n=1 Tax=Actinomadura sp. WMMA1423 TaxID=2591108 RepID=UPI001146F809|nr:hypothetical protein [Actinomadura sp. WMMA1423]